MNLRHFMMVLLILIAADGLAQEPTPPIDLKPDASGAVPPEQIRELLRRAEERDLENDKRQRDYTYIERVERHTLDRHGGVKKSEVPDFGGVGDLWRTCRAANRKGR